MTASPRDQAARGGERGNGRRRAGGRIPRGVVALLAAWLGAALFFAAGVAPAAFAVLPTSADAGALVGRLLPILFVAGALLGATLIAAAAALGSAGRFLRRMCGVAGLVMLACCGLAQAWVAPEIARVRDAAGSFENRPPDDPLRMRFGRLHALSVALLGVAWLGAAATLAIALLPARRRG